MNQPTILCYRGLGPTPFVSDGHLTRLAIVLDETADHWLINTPHRPNDKPLTLPKGAWAAVEPPASLDTVHLPYDPSPAEIALYAEALRIAQEAQARRG